jgi:ATP-dependent exoDNAse (exonuclease V) beta subunit
LTKIPFKIYNASAGSGKTFTLVKAYLKALLKSPYKDGFKNALAITFTNKAVGEMKSRIMAHLKEFSNHNSNDRPSDMFVSIGEELNLKPEEVQKKSKKILNAILYNYAAFDIHTIDKFTQKLIRTFAYDLKLPLNFEVELDTDLVCQRAVNNLISQAGKSKKLTRTLVDFALEKVDDDKSWDISKDLFLSSKLLVQENDKAYLEILKDRTLDDFEEFKNELRHKLKDLENKITSTANDTLTFIEQCGLEHEDFSRNSLPNFFIALKEKKLNSSLDRKWQQNIEHQKLYTQKTQKSSPEIAEIIDRIQPEIAIRFKKVKQHIHEFKFWRAVYAELTPMSVLNLINHEMNKIKEDENKILISEFNSIISNELKSQPIPFIYERIGEKYKHYFIDEFQDTSILQWQNLIPLLENALSAEGGTALIVGDAKQAIYRWRGGKAEQFIDLCNGVIPFYASHKTYNLPANYRSHKAIVEFNNSFFQYLSSFAFTNPTYSTLYKNCIQEIKSPKEGFVNITFIDSSDKELEAEQHYAEQVLKNIKLCLDYGFSLNEICILVRYKKHGILISEYLIEHGIDIISSETLLIKNALEVRFIIDLLEYLVDPENELAKIKALNFLADFILKISETHEFLKLFIGSDTQSTFKNLKKFGFDFNEEVFQALPFYEAIEYLIFSFNLFDYSSAYLLFFLDFVLEFTKQPQVDTLDFLAYYDLKKDNLSIISSEETEAVKIMTIHKAKGLEFPVVIFPFADLNIYKDKDLKIWFPIPP